MSFRDCVLGNIDRNHKRYAEATDMLDRFDVRVDELKATGMNDVTAKSAATEEFVTNNSEEKKWVKIRRVREAQVQMRQSARIMKTKSRPGRELTTIFSEMERVSNGYLGHFQAMANEFINDYDTRVLGAFRRKAGLNDVLKELYRTNSGSPQAKAYADAITQTYAEIAKLVRANGVNMVDDFNFHAPQKHDINKLVNAGRDTWVKDHLEMDVLDWNNMKQFNGGKMIEGRAERQRVLNDVYDTLTQDGMNKQAFDYKVDTSVAGRLTQKRFLRYKTPKSWQSIQDKYGAGSLADQMINYMDSAAKDLAQLQVLGPNPAVTKRKLESVVQQRTSQLIKKHEGTKKAVKEKSKVQRDIRHADDVYGLVTGRNSKIDDNFVASVGATMRLTAVGALLGKTVLTAVPTDIALMKHAAMYSGHGAMKPVRQYLKLMNPANKADRDFARRSGVINNLVMANLSSGERFGGDPFGPLWARHMAEGAIRATGLAHHTEMARWSFAMGLMGNYADNSKVKFNDLPFKERLEKHQITESDWDMFRSTQIETFKGATFLRPRDLLLRDDVDMSKATEVFSKFSSYQAEFTELAVPTATTETRASLIGQTVGGTIPGEVMRSASMFMNFPITIMMRHWREGLAQASLGGKVKFGMSFIGMLTAAGALSEQLRAVADGKDLHDMNPVTNPAFYANSLARGGGMGLFGDFITSDANRYGGGFFQTLIGPVADMLDMGVGKTGLGQVQKALRGDDTDVMLSVAKLLRKYTPGSHAWYLDKAVNSLFEQFVLEDLDPKHHQKMQRKIRRLSREGGGQEYFWKPGRALPDRAPQLTTVR